MKPTLYSEAYRIAELAHKGVDDDYLMEQCEAAAANLDNVTATQLYAHSEAIYNREFSSR